MTEDRRRRAEEIFQDAADLAPADRARYVRDACAGDELLLAEVASLLSHLEEAFSDEFLARPAFDHRLGGDFEIPERIGHYRIVGRLGEGGMGVVFEAEQDSPRRRVALKVIRPGLHGPDVRRRFEYESEILARLQHPSIAHVYDAGVFEVGREEGIAVPLPYFAMELVRGVAIDRWVRESGASVRGIVDLMATVVEAVEAAHRRGVIHRDLKPANVVVDDAGRPKVLDFGLARAVDARPRSLHTGAGIILGTIPYVSPEQLTGDPDAIDTRTDVYSLGVMLLELLIGEPAIDVSELPLPEAIRRSREEALPRPSKRNRRVDDELETIVLRATERDRTRRYSSAGALAEDLRRYLRREPIEAKRDSGWYVARTQIRRYRGAFASALTLLAVLVVATVVGFTLYLRADEARRGANEQLWEAQLQQARAAVASETIGRRSRGLQALAAAARLRPDRALRDEAIACMALDDLRLEREVELRGEYATCYGLSWVDRYAEVQSDGRVQVRALADSTSIAVIPAPEEGPLEVTWMCFDPRGRRLAVRRYNGVTSRLRVWDLESGECWLELGPEDHGHRCLAFGRSAGGAEFLLMAIPDGRVRLHELPGGRVLREIQTPSGPVRLVIDPTGRSFAISHQSTETIQIHRIDDLQPVISLRNDARAFALAFARDGERIVAGGSDHMVRVFDVDNPVPRAVLQGHQSAVVEAGVVLGSELAITGSWDQTVRFWDIERGREAFSPETRYVFDAVGDRVVLESPDRSLAVWDFERSREFVSIVAPSSFAAPSNGQLFDRGTRAITTGGNGVLEWNLETRRLQRVLTDMPARDLVIDAQRGAAVVTMVEGVREFRLQDADSTSSRMLLADGRFEGIATHPDGWIVAGRSLVTTFDASGLLRRLPHPEGANTVAVSPDSRWVFVGTWRGEPARLFDNLTFRALRQFPGPHVRATFDPRGRWLVIVDGQEVHVYQIDPWEEIFREERNLPGQSLSGPAAFSPDGSLLAVTLDQYHLELIDTRDFTTVARLANPAFTTITRIDFSEDGQRLLLVGTGTRLHMWDLGLVRERLRELGLDWDQADNSPQLTSDGDLGIGRR